MGSQFSANTSEMVETFIVAAKAYLKFRMRLLEKCGRFFDHRVLRGGPLIVGMGDVAHQGVGVDKPSQPMVLSHCASGYFTAHDPRPHCPNIYPQ